MEIKLHTQQRAVKRAGFNDLVCFTWILLHSLGVFVQGEESLIKRKLCHDFLWGSLFNSFSSQKKRNLISYGRRIVQDSSLQWKYMCKILPLQQTSHYISKLSCWLLIGNLQVATKMNWLEQQKQQLQKLCKAWISIINKLSVIII